MMIVNMARHGGRYRLGLIFTVLILNGASCSHEIFNAHAQMYRNLTVGDLQRNVARHSACFRCLLR